MSFWLDLFSRKYSNVISSIYRALLYSRTAKSARIIPATLLWQGTLLYQRRHHYAIPYHTSILLPSTINIAGSNGALNLIVQQLRDNIGQLR
jgi:hypothetical protein